MAGRPIACPQEGFLNGALRMKSALRERRNSSIRATSKRLEQKVALPPALTLGQPSPTHQSRLVAT